MKNTLLSILKDRISEYREQREQRALKNKLLSILKDRMSEYRTLSYLLLTEKIKENEVVTFESGVFGSSDFYQGEIIFAIDNETTGDIRIMGDIGDGKGNKARYDIILDKVGNEVGI